MSVELAFFPALSATTVVAIPPQRGIGRELVFKATFSSLAARDQARRDGIRVEMWTDLPMPGRVQGEWGALEFKPREHTLVAGEDTPALALYAQEERPDSSGVEDECAVYASLLLTLPDHSPAQFRYMYRLMHQSGAISWLGHHWQNGHIHVERRYSGVSLGAAWRVRDDGEYVLGYGSSEDAAALLDGEMEWSSCALGKDSWPVFSSFKERSASPCSTVVLFPRYRGNAHNVITPEPLVLSASVGAVRVNAGHIHWQTDGAGDGHLSLRVWNSSCADAFSMPRSSVQHFVVRQEAESPCIVLASRIAHAASPLILSAIPLRSSAPSMTRLCIGGRVLAGLLPDTPCDQVALFSPSTGGSLFVDVDSTKADEHITLRVGIPGGQVILSPVYILVVPRGPAEGYWELSLLQPHSTASVTRPKEMESEMTEPAMLLLPTPPPSPPPMCAEPAVVSKLARREPALPSIASVFDIPGSMPRSHSATSSSGGSSSPASPTRTSAKDAFALVRRQNEPTPHWLAAIMAMFALIWHTVLKRLASLWTGVGATPPSHQGTEESELKVSADGGESTATGEQPLAIKVEVDDVGMETVGPTGDAATLPMDAPTPHAAVQAPGAEQFAKRAEPPPRPPPSFSADVCDLKYGTVTMLVRPPARASPTALKVAFDGRTSSEMRLTEINEKTYSVEVGVQATEGMLEVFFAE